MNEHTPDPDARPLDDQDPLFLGPAGLPPHEAKEVVVASAFERIGKELMNHARTLSAEIKIRGGQDSLNLEGAFLLNLLAMALEACHRGSQVALGITPALAQTCELWLNANGDDGALVDRLFTRPPMPDVGIGAGEGDG